MMAAYTAGTIVQPKATTKAGAMNLFTAAPELPAPYTPIARPWRLRGNQRATYGVPTEKDPPAKPTNSPITRKCQKAVAYDISQIAGTVTAISTAITMRPPYRSVQIPSGT